MENDLLEPVGPSGGGGAPLPRRSVRAEYGDLALGWFAAVIGGAAAIALIPERSGALRMGAPILVMCLYCWFAVTRSRFSTAKVADSVYFMGFLWTLWALIDVLVFNPSLSAARLYEAFGYALTATTTGMFLRLSLLQFYRTVDDQEEQAVDTIDQRVSRLLAELRETERHVVNLRATTGTQLAAWHKEHDLGMQGHLKRLRDGATAFQEEADSLVEAVRGIRKSVSVTSRAFSDAEKKVSAVSQILSERLGSAGESVERGFEDLARKIVSLQLPEDMLSGPLRKLAEDAVSAMAPTQKAVASLAEDVSRSARQLEDVLRTLREERVLEQPMRDAAAQVTTAADACRLLAEELGQIGAAVDGLRGAAERATGKAKAAESVIETGLQAVTQRIEAAESSARSLDGDVKKASKALEDIVSFVRSELR